MILGSDQNPVGQGEYWYLDPARMCPFSGGVAEMEAKCFGDDKSKLLQVVLIVGGAVYEWP